MVDDDESRNAAVSVDDDGGCRDDSNVSSDAHQHAYSRAGGRPEQPTSRCLLGKRRPLFISGSHGYNYYWQLDESRGCLSICENRQGRRRDRTVAFLSVLGSS